MTPKRLGKQAFQRPKWRDRMPAACWGTHAERQKTAAEAAEVESVPKARPDPDCMAGRDFRGQNDAKKLKKQGFQRTKSRA